MSLYHCEVTCPRCGRHVDHVTGSEANPILCVESSAIVKCGACRESWLVRIEMSSLKAGRITHPPMFDDDVTSKCRTPADPHPCEVGGRHHQPPTTIHSNQPRHKGRER